MCGPWMLWFVSMIVSKTRRMKCRRGWNIPAAKTATWIWARRWASEEMGEEVGEAVDMGEGMGEAVVYQLTMVYQLTYTVLALLALLL